MVTFHAICPIEQLSFGERLYIEVDRLPIVVLNIAGKFYAIGDVCTHDHGPLGDGEVEGNAIKCPRHGARFDIGSGKVLALPAVEDIPAYPLKITNGMIQIGIPK
ncbi:MAG: biphenyl 2,3-dioxygenase [Anaerolinea sp.]|nr:biphenyl 2,3-dioxygenase [Anaerolinea sp.]